MTDNHLEKVLDVTRLLCPLPVLRARKQLNSMRSGDVLVVRATDPMSAIDMPNFCAEQGHELVHQERDGAVFQFRIRRR